MPDFNHPPLHIHVFGVYKRDPAGAKDVSLPASIVIEDMIPLNTDDIPVNGTVTSALVGGTGLGTNLNLLFNLSVVTDEATDVTYTLTPLADTTTRKNAWYDLLLAGTDVGDGTVSTNLTFFAGGLPHRQVVYFHFRGISAERFLALANSDGSAVSQSQLAFSAGAPVTNETVDWTLASSPTIGGTGRWQNGMVTYTQDVAAGDPDPVFTLLSGVYADGNHSMPLTVQTIAPNPSPLSGDRNDLFQTTFTLTITTRRLDKDGYTWVDGQLAPADASQRGLTTTLVNPVPSVSPVAKGVQTTSTLAAQTDLPGGAMNLNLDLAITNAPTSSGFIDGQMRVYIELPNYAPTLSPPLSLLKTSVSQSDTSVNPGGTLEFTVDNPATINVDWTLSWLPGASALDPYNGSNTPTGNPLSLTWPATVVDGTTGELRAAVKEAGTNMATALWQSAEITGVVVLSPTRKVALLLDRSGSMSGVRWSAATDSARCFCAHLAAMNETRPAGSKHEAGIYFYWGHPNAVDWTMTDDVGRWNYNPALPGNHNNDMGTGLQNFGTLPNSAAVAMSLSEQTEAANYGDSTITAPVDHFTAIGSGILHARDVLDAAGVTLAEGAILALSDGMENAGPHLAQVFDPISTGPLASLYPTGVYDSTPGPNYPLYTVALQTATAWASLLESYSSDVPDGLGGTKPGSKHITATDISTATTKCIEAYVEFFQEIFGWTPIVVTDPELSASEKATHTFPVGPEHDMLAFTLMGHGKVLDEDGEPVWKIGVQPPGGNIVWNNQMGLIRSTGDYFMTVSAPVPLEGDGEQHRTVGDWTVHVQRLSGSGNYSAHIMLLPKYGSKPPVTVEVERPEVVDEGDVIIVEVDATHPGTHVKPPVVEVCFPEPWWGDIIARRLRTGRPFLSAGGPLEPIPGTKQYSPAHEATVALGEIERPVKRQCRRFRLLPRAGGGFTLALPVKLPGTYSLKVIVEGHRGFHFPAEKVRTRIDKSLASYEEALRRIEFATLKENWDKTPFHIETMYRINARLRPDKAKTSVTGTLSGGTLTLAVTPRNAAGVFLGPGWEREVEFRTPWGKGVALEPREEGTGTYSVEVKLHYKDAVWIPKRKALLVKALAQKVPGCKELRSLPGTLVGMGQFGVTVLGRWFPIEVEVEARDPSRMLAEIPSKEVKLRVPAPDFDPLKKHQRALVKKLAKAVENLLTRDAPVRSGAWQSKFQDQLVHIQGAIVLTRELVPEVDDSLHALASNVQYLAVEYGTRALTRPDIDAFVVDLDEFSKLVGPFLGGKPSKKDS